ncbi:MAG TPA: M56 family metallopeptidase [Clostridia bacterium]|nr:M56 family metallopeptidase [Clostridia bacterium]
MSNLFIAVANMSVTASFAALVVILVRLLVRKTPKVFSYALWSVVLFRMVCPVSFESALSLVPGNPRAIPQNIAFSPNPAVETGVRSIDSTVNRTVGGSLPPVNPAASVNPMGIVIEIAAIIWLLGMAVLLCYSAVSYMGLKSRLSTATLVGGNVYESDRIRTPFVLGFFKPRVLIPVGLDPGEMEYVLQHEKVHIRRRDHLIKPAAYLAVILHWFNPLLWLSYFLMVRDMEMSCDESVMRQTDGDARLGYSNSLLRLSERQSGLISPLAFGESSVKSRIKNVLRYKKPSFWVTALVAVLVAAAAVGLAANPADKRPHLSYADKLYKYKTEYMGNASKVGGIIALLDFPDGVEYDHFELFTGSSPFGFTVHLKTDTETRDFYDRQSDWIPYEKNAIVMFSLIDNVGYINFDLSDNNKCISLQYTREWANDYMGGDVREFAKDREEFEEFLERMGYANNTPGGSRVNPEDRGISDGTPMAVEEKIKIILSSPKESSNPQDYIDAHWKEYEGILKLGNEALDYLLSEFEKGVENDLRGHIMMRLCKEMLGPRQSTADDTLPPQEWYSQLTIHEETRLPDFAYDGDDPIERLVYATEAEMNKNPYRGGFVVAAPKIHAYYEMGGVLKVFVTTYSVNYHLYDKVLSRDGGGIVPAAITYVKDNRGEYKLEEYKQTLDGAYFGQSIRDFCTMPVSGKRIEGLAELILAHYSDCDDIRDLHRENLIKHLKANNQTGVKLRMHSGSETPLT